MTKENTRNKTHDKMKKIQYILGILFATLLVACNDVVDMDDGWIPAGEVINTGAPQITGVYEITDTAYAKKIREGEPGQMVCLIGTNLNHASKILFNTVEADLSEAYSTSTKTIVKIPVKVSLEQVNKIEYTTPQGTGAYDFLVLLPEMRLEGLYNEFCVAGETTKVNGAYFDLYGFGRGEASITLDGRKLTVSEVSDESMSVTIPYGTAENSELIVTWYDRDHVKQVRTIFFRPAEYILFEDLPNACTKTAEYISFENDEDVPDTRSMLGRPHLHLSGNVEQWSWIEAAFNELEPQLNGIDISEYELAFEFLTSVNHPLPSFYDGTDDGLMLNINSGIRYEFDPVHGKLLDTNGNWQTFRIPLEKFMESGSTFTKDDFSLGMVFTPNVACNADFRMGNFRIQKKQQKVETHLIINGLRNEFANAGEMVEVDGRNFKIYGFDSGEGTVSINGTQLTVSDVTNTSMKVLIPVGTPDNSELLFTWNDESGQQTKIVHFRPTDDLIFEDITKTVQGPADRNANAEIYGGVSCLHFFGTLREWSWVELSCSRPSWESVPASAVVDYYFVFEVMTASGYPLLSKGYEFAWNGDWNNSCRWNPETDTDTHGQWLTVRCPLEEMAPEGLPGGSVTLNVGFQPYKTVDVDFRLANFRLEKK